MDRVVSGGAPDAAGTGGGSSLPRCGGPGPAGGSRPDAIGSQGRTACGGKVAAMKGIGFVLGLLLAGCYLPPSQEEWNAADFGPPPGDDYQDQIKKRMESVLLDPFTAQYKFENPPQHAWYRKPDDSFGFGWGIFFQVNAKNSFGGYAGWKLWLATFDHGVLTAIVQKSQD